MENLPSSSLPDIDKHFFGKFTAEEEGSQNPAMA
jgi:hypothetical protein